MLTKSLIATAEAKKAVLIQLLADGSSTCLVVGQAMIPLAANPVYGWLYRATVAWQPGTFLLFNAVLSSAIFLLLLTVNLGLVRQASQAAAATTNPLLAPPSHPV